MSRDEITPPGGGLPGGVLDAEDLRQFRRSLAGVLGRAWPSAGAALRASDRTATIGLWATLIETGLAGLGGDDGDVAALAIAMVELGRSGAPAPLLGAAVLRRALRRDASAAQLLADVEAGRARIAAGFGAHDGDPLGGAIRILNGAVSGVLGGVEDVAIATHVLTISDAGDQLAVVRADDPALVTEAQPGFAAPASVKLVLDGAAALTFRLGPGEAEQLADLARLLLIARAFGAQQRAFDLALDYVKLREQFGKPIGAFQALQHKLADCHVRAELTRLLIDEAVQGWRRSRETSRLVATLASVGGPALRQNALEIQHVFGAIGFAEEHEAAQRFRRVHADTLRLGGARRARRLIADRLFDVARRDDILPTPEDDAALASRRRDIRAWIQANWTDEQLQAARRDPSRDADYDLGFLKALGAKGWLSANWPKAHGGLEFSAFEQLVLLEELRSAKAPITISSPSSWVVAPAIIAYGDAELQQRFLPAIARGEATFCLGYSEPGAGSDLAALTTRAVRDGDSYVITGQKIWTSLAKYATHVFLAARTGGDDQPKHRGVSMFVVPLDSPGIEIRQMRTLHGKTFASVFYDDVRIPAAFRVGPENGGWQVLSSALAAERVVMGGQVAGLRRVFRDLVKAARDRPDIACDPVVREQLAAFAAELDGARALARHAVQLVDRSEPAAVEGGMAKLYTGDLAERIGEAALDLFGAQASLDVGAPDALLDGEVSQQLRTAIMWVIGGGTPEIQRTLIAQRGLGLPR